jgi:hypothetical protein
MTVGWADRARRETRGRGSPDTSVKPHLLTQVPGKQPDDLPSIDQSEQMAGIVDDDESLDLILHHQANRVTKRVLGPDRERRCHERGCG